MALILIAEPSAAVRQLLEQVVTDLGHQAISPTDRSGDLDCDVVLLEPTWPLGRRLAERLGSRKPRLPSIFIGSTKHPRVAGALVAHAEVAKPFALQDLQRAIADAVTEAEAQAGR
jgi:CheY-like chemotaxis protein